MKEIPDYATPQDFRCPSCREKCKIVPLLNDYAYSGTHCTHGLDGTHYPENFGDPVCDQCHASIEDYSEDYYEERIM